MKTGASDDVHRLDRSAAVPARCSGQGAQDSGGRPAVIATAMSAAATKSTAAQNGGHQRGPATKPGRGCHKSLRPGLTKPTTINHAHPGTPAAAATTHADAPGVSAA